MSTSEPPDTIPAEHAAVARFRAELDRRLAQITGSEGSEASAAETRIRVLPASVHTAALAAEALGCAVGAIANSLLFAADDEPLLLLTSGAHRVDTDKVARTLGITTLRRARPDFVRRHTGQVIGGVSPFAHPAPVRTYLDPALSAYDVVWAAAGHPAAVFRSTYAELRAMTGAEEVEVD